MSKLKEVHKIVRQNENSARKSQKHEVNLKSSSTLYFQIGLILCLLGSYLVLEMTFEKPKDFVYKTPDLTGEILYDSSHERYEVETKVVKQLPLPKKTITLDPKYEAVDNDTKIEQYVEQIIQPIKSSKLIGVAPPIKEEELEVEEPEEVVSIMAVQKVPVYPGCERKKNNTERRKCMSNKLGKLIQKKFDSDLGADLGLRGLQKIDVFFKINKQGGIEILNTRAPHVALEKEAKRVVSKVPIIQPGMNNNKPVEVSYNLPIRFNIRS